MYVCMIISKASKIQSLVSSRGNAGNSSNKKYFFKTHFEFEYFSFFLTHLKLKR